MDTLVREEVCIREAVGPVLCIGPVGVYFEAVDVADDEEGRIAQRLTVIGDLFVCCGQVFALTFVFPGEVSLEPDVGKAFAVGSPGTFLEGVEIAAGVGFGRGLLAKQAADVDKVLNGGLAFSAS